MATLSLYHGKVNIGADDRVNLCDVKVTEARLNEVATTTSAGATLILTSKKNA